MGRGRESGGEVRLHFLQSSGGTEATGPGISHCIGWALPFSWRGPRSNLRKTGSLRHCKERCRSPWRQLLAVTPEEGTLGSTVSKAAPWGKLLSEDRAHEPRPEGHLGQNCPPALALLLLPLAASVRAWQLQQNILALPHPAHATWLGESAGSLQRRSWHLS